MVMIINDISVFGVVQQRKTKTQAMILAVLLAATTSAATSGLAHRSPPAAFGAGARPQALWIHGAMFPAPAGTTVCSTSNGCTLGAFIACSDSSQAITNITFASYVSLRQQPTCLPPEDPPRCQSELPPPCHQGPPLVPSIADWRVRAAGSVTLCG